MFHHDSRNKEEAMSAAAKLMREKLHATINSARDKSAAAITRIEREIPTDYLMRSKTLEVEAVDGGVFIDSTVNNTDVRLAVHPWAIGQMCESAGLPRAYLSMLMAKKDDWAAKLVAKNFQELFHHMDTKHMVRAYDTTARGFLSARYQRRHPGELLDVFIQGCKKHNLIAYEAWCSDTKHAVHAVLDRIVEPIRDECLGIGVVYSESPYGNGATELRATIRRMWCTNTAIVEENVRARHLGSSLTDDVAWSDETYRRDTALMSSRLVDTMQATMSEKAIAELEAGVRLAHELKIDPHSYEAFLKKNLAKDDVNEVLGCFRSADVEMMPAGNTAWRASNAISFFAGQQTDEEKKHDLQKLAGRALTAFRGKA
jgi:hypothetical protein